MFSSDKLYLGYIFSLNKNINISIDLIKSQIYNSDINVYYLNDNFFILKENNGSINIKELENINSYIISIIKKLVPETDISYINSIIIPDLQCMKSIILQKEKLK